MRVSAPWVVRTGNHPNRVGVLFILMTAMVSGMRKMMMYGKKYGGADPQLIEGDVFRMMISVPEFGDNPAVVPEIERVTPEVTPEVRLLTVLTGEMTRQQLQVALTLRDDEHFRKAYLLPALEAALIEMTIPDKPKSSKQKYRLTEKGKKILEDVE